MVKNNETSLELVVGRLEKVERANRRLTLVSFALGAGFVLLLVLVAAIVANAPTDYFAPMPKEVIPVRDLQPYTADVLRAKKLEIVDDKGNVRAALAARMRLTEYVDGAGLVLYDEKGRVRAGLGSADGTGLQLRDEKGNMRAALGGIAGGSALALYDEEGNERAWVRVGAEGPNMELQDNAGNVIWQAPK